MYAVSDLAMAKVHLAAFRTHAAHDERCRILYVILVSRLSTNVGECMCCAALGNYEDIKTGKLGQPSSPKPSFAGSSQHCMKSSLLGKQRFPMYVTLSDQLARFKSTTC